MARGATADRGGAVPSAPNAGYCATLKVPEAATRTTLKRLMRMGQLVEVAPDHFFLRGTVAEMAAIAAAAVDAEGLLTAAAFRDRLDNGRKVAILILEFFDKAGITVRSGDVRRVRTDRLGIFGPRRTVNSTAASFAQCHLGRLGETWRLVLIPDGSPAAQQVFERGEHPAHLRLFVRKQVRRIHHVDDGGGVRLEHQQPAVARLGAVDRVVVETQTFVQCIECGGVTAGEAIVEFNHRLCLLGALFGRLGHACIEVVHHPVAGDRHVAQERLAVDEGDAEFAIQAVGTAVVLERRDKEMLVQRLCANNRSRSSRSCSRARPAPACESTGRIRQG